MMDRQQFEQVVVDHASGLRLLFERFGITDPVSPQAVAARLEGAEFRQAFSDLVTGDPGGTSPDDVSDDPAPPDDAEHFIGGNDDDPPEVEQPKIAWSTTIWVLVILLLLVVIGFVAVKFTK